MTILQAGHDIQCMFTTPKLLEALALRLESMGTTHPEDGHHRHLLRRHRVHAAVEPLRARGAARRRLHDADLRQHADGPGRQRAERPAQQLQDHLLRAAAARGRSRSSTSTIRSRSSTTAQTGRVKLTTLTKEFFMPGFLERDEGEREPPYEQYPVGRRQRRAAVPRVRGDDDGRRVLEVRRSRSSQSPTSKLGHLVLVIPCELLEPWNLEPLHDQHSRSPLGPAVHEPGRRRGRALRRPASRSPRSAAPTAG